jgi:hypothetical protein
MLRGVLHLPIQYFKQMHGSYLASRAFRCHRMPGKYHIPLHLIRGMSSTFPVMFLFYFKFLHFVFWISFVYLPSSGLVVPLYPLKSSIIDPYFGIISWWAILCESLASEGSGQAVNTTSRCVITEACQFSSSTHCLNSERLISEVDLLIIFF